MRDTFSKSLVQWVEKNANVYLLSGDHGYALFDLLRKEKPEHFINAGVAEQNMVGVAAGLAKTDFYPIVYGLSAFIPIRVLEQIKIDFCYENLPGLFIGDGAGVVYSHLGASHQSTEDIAALRALPNISILSPCDRYELKACFEWGVRQKSPVYLRMGKADLGDVHSSELSELGDLPIPVVQTGSKNAIYATGSMVRPCLDLVQKKLVDADLFSVPLLKKSQPISLKQSVQNYSKIATVEEHSVYGGLGDIFSEIIAELGTIKLKRFGITNRFSEKCGTYQYLMQEHGLDSESLKRKINQWF